MIESQENIISPGKLIMNGGSIPMNNNEALSFLHEECRLGIETNNLCRIVEAHRDIFSIIRRFEAWYWNHPSQNQINEQLRITRLAIEQLRDQTLNEEGPVNLKRRRIQ